MCKDFVLQLQKAVYEKDTNQNINSCILNLVVRLQLFCLKTCNIGNMAALRCDAESRLISH